MTTHPRALDLDAEIDPALTQCPICDGPVVAYVGSLAEIADGDPAVAELTGGHAVCCLCGHSFDWHEERTACEVWDLIAHDLKPEVIG